MVMARGCWMKIYRLPGTTKGHYFPCIKAFINKNCGDKSASDCNAHNEFYYIMEYVPRSALHHEHVSQNVQQSVQLYEKEVQYIKSNSLTG